MASWSAVREAKAFAPGVTGLSWEFPLLQGPVSDGKQTWAARVDFRSQSLPRNHCACPMGKKQQLCAHALALYFAWQAKISSALTPLISSAPGAAPARRSSGISSPSAPMRVEGSPQYLAITLPSREHPHYAAALDLLKQNAFQLDPSSRTWWLRDRHRVLNFLAENASRLPREFDAQFTSGFLQRTAVLGTAKLVADAVELASGDFSFAAHIDTGSADTAALRDALARNQRYVESPDGKITLLPPDVLAAAQTLTEKISSSSASGLLPRLERTVPSRDLADLENTLEALSISFAPPETWRARSAALRNLSALAQAPCSAALQNQLRLYQQIGAAWLWHLFRHQLGGILADEMGLGKTVQAIAFLEAVSASGTQPALVVCPAALIENWCRELARFSPGLAVLRHHGSKRAAEISFAGEAGKTVVVTSYGTLTRDAEILNTHHWSVILADEAQHIKNRRSQNARSLRFLRADVRFVLTGTPVENSLDDLRSLFEFLMPGYLSAPRPRAEREERQQADARVREKVAPYILRRTKQAVAPELPEKIAQTLYCELEDAQAMLYQNWRERSRAEVFELEMSGAGEGRIRIALFNQLLRLRQLCAEPRILAPEIPPAQSAKARALRELLDQAIDGGHRILLFSQFVEALHFLRDDLSSAGISFCYLDGTTRDRQAECDRFNHDASIPIFLISLKAGGVGLNLTGADTVVHFDPWWNPAAEAQATDRAHRIGQRKTVTSIKLIAAGTVEERVLELQRTKADLLREIFSASDAANAQISLDDLRSLLD